jgi:hypothetical protein
MAVKTNLDTAWKGNVRGLTPGGAITKERSGRTGNGRRGNTQKTSRARSRRMAERLNG